MLISFLAIAFAKPIFKVDLTSLEITGTGTIFQSDYQNSGSYQSYTSIVIDGPSAIYDEALHDSISLKTIYIGSSITSISTPFCRNCQKLSSITINKNNLNYDVEQNILYSHNFSNVVRVPPQLTNVKVNQKATCFLQQAFQLSICTSIVIPKNVSLIEPGCFFDTETTQIDFEEDSVILSLGYKSFSVAHKLLKMKIPKSVQRIETMAFQNTYAMTSLTFEEGSQLTTIGSSCFIKSAIKSIVLPPSVTTVLEEAFSQCVGLNSIVISKNLSSLSNTAFSGCTALRDITIRPENIYFYFNGFALMDKANTTIYAISIDATYLNVTAECSYISATSLQALTKLQSIYIPSSNEYFEEEDNIIYRKGKAEIITVSGSVTSVTLDSEKLKTIGQYSFYNHQKIASVIIKSNITSIGSYAFSSSALVSVTLPSTIQSIHTYAFSSCSRLERVTIPEENDLVDISNSAFLSTKLLSGTFYLGKKFSKLGSQAFYTSGVTEIVFHRDCPLEMIDTISIRNTKITSITFPRNLKDLTYQSVSKNPNLVEVKFTSQIEYIFDEVFEGCPKLKILQFPSSLKQLGIYCFRGDSSLQSVTFDSGSLLSSIGSGCFESCTNLGMFILPEKVTSIEPSIFYKCTSLTTVSSQSEMFTSKGNVLYDSPITTLIFCPAGITQCTADPEIKAIGNNAFYGCTKLTSIDLQQTTKLDSIGSNTFYECISLTAITIPQSVSSIKPNAFKLCSSLTDVTFDGVSNLLKLESNTFSGCKTLKHVVFSDDAHLNSIDSSMFADSSLESFFFPSSIQNLGSSIFENCVNLTSVTFGPKFNMSALSANCFKGCTKLETIRFPNSIKTIHSSCFEGCSLLSVSNIENIIKISNRAFFGCNNIKIDLPQNIESIGISSFERPSSTKSPLEYERDELIIPASLISIGSRAFIGCPVSIVYYCGITKMEIAPVFDVGVVAYVRTDYEKGASFLGLPTFRCLEQNCVLIPPSPTNTMLFTSNEGIVLGLESVFIPLILGSCSEAE